MSFNSLLLLLLVFFTEIDNSVFSVSLLLKSEKIHLPCLGLHYSYNGNQTLMFSLLHQSKKKKKKRKKERNRERNYCK